MHYIVQDPVCGESLDWQKASVINYQGKLYYFCCRSCLARFQKAPRRYCCKVCIADTGRQCMSHPDDRKTPGNT
jgi:YHS domain-containing protein